jgi:hypothetical protein
MRICPFGPMTVVHWSLASHHCADPPRSVCIGEPVSMYELPERLWCPRVRWLYMGINLNEFGREPAASLELPAACPHSAAICKSNPHIKSTLAIIREVFLATSSLLLDIKTILVDLRIVVKLIGIEAKE